MNLEYKTKHRPPARRSGGGRSPPEAPRPPSPAPPPQVFQHAQDVDDTEDCDQTMMLPEFLDGLVLVAMFKHPAPYVSLAERLDQFLVVNVLVPLRFKFEWESPELNAAAVRYNIVALR